MSAYKLSDRPGAEVIRQRVQGTVKTQGTIRRRPLPKAVEILLAIIVDCLLRPLSATWFAWLLLIVFFSTVGFVWTLHTLGLLW